MKKANPGVRSDDCAEYQLIAGEAVRVPYIVLLETDDTVVEAAEEVRNALDWYERGADFADALQPVACGTAVMTQEVRIWGV